MRQPLEFSIELSAQELLAPPTFKGLVEIEDACSIDTQEVAALAASTTLGTTLSTKLAPAVRCDEDSVEIELTAAEMDALLSEDWKP